ncbi:MAG: hypothetical protein PHI63_01510 [Patescibacteria group bacterium]|nr:hypothetical protein [Patescibacteria group bacterium]
MDIRPVHLPLWLCGLSSALLGLAAQATFLAVTGPGYCLVPAGIFALSIVVLAGTSDDNWQEGPASLWLGVATASIGFNILCIISAIAIASWWLLTPMVIGIMLCAISFHQCHECVDGGWCEPVQVIVGAFRFPLWNAVAVNLIWKTGHTATIVCAMCALTTIQSSSCYCFLGGAAVAFVLPIATFIYRYRCERPPESQPFDATALKERGLIEVPPPESDGV